MNKFARKSAAWLLGLTIAFSMPFASIAAEPSTQKNSKNVIILIPDGMSTTGTTLARWYQGGAPLAMDEMASGLVRTYWAAGAITDSAPAGTALATGNKSYNKFISVLPDKVDMPGVPAVKPENAKKPVATLLEAAKLAGKATGIIATSNIQHATPATFSSHYPDRSRYDILGEQQVYNNIDVVLGSGYQYLMSQNRKDKEDLLGVLKAKGYDYITTPEQMKKSTSAKLWGLFTPDAMAYEMDREPGKEPSLAEMTEKALDILSKDSDGFFLMVEGSKVDWAAHANDPIGIISDVLAFDKAVKVALDFAKKDGNTVVLACTDHGNGGISMGSTGTNSGYDSAPLSKFMEQLTKAKLTGEGLEKKILPDKSNIKEVMAEYYGISNLTEDETKAIAAAKPGSLNSVVGPMISKRANIGWTTTGHTGEEVTLYSYLPGNQRLTGVIDNTDIAKYAATAMNVNLEEATLKLFVPVRGAFEAKGATVAWDETDMENPLIVITKGTDILKLPVYKNIAELNGKAIEMKGIVVFNGEKCFVPQEAVDLIK